MRGREAEITAIPENNGNYGAISRLSADLKKIQSKISSLEIKDSMGGDAQLEEEINRLQNGVSVVYEVFYFRL